MNSLRNRNDNKFGRRFVILSVFRSIVLLIYLSQFTIWEVKKFHLLFIYLLSNLSIFFFLIFSEI